MEELIEQRDREPSFQLQAPEVQIYEVAPGDAPDQAWMMELTGGEDTDEPEAKLSEDFRPLTWETLIKRTGQTVLTADEEVTLAKDIEVGLTARHILDHLDENPEIGACHKDDQGTKGCGIFEIAQKHEISRDELVLLAQNGIDARQTFILANAGLAASLARAKTKPGELIDDKAQDSTIGVMQALEKFDYTRGFKFSTFASTAVGHVIARRQYESGAYSPFSIGSSAIERLESMARVYRNLKQDLQREPEIDEVAKVMDKTVEEVAALRQTYKAVDGKSFLYLDQPVRVGSTKESKEVMLGDIVEDRSQSSPLEKAIENDEIKRLHEAINFIQDPDTKRMFEMYYGLDGGDGKTLREIGKEFYMTGTGVGARIKKAFAEVEAYFKNPAAAKAARGPSRQGPGRLFMNPTARRARLRREGYNV